MNQSQKISVQPLSSDAVAKSDIYSSQDLSDTYQENGKSKENTCDSCTNHDDNGPLRKTFNLLITGEEYEQVCTGTGNGLKIKFRRRSADVITECANPHNHTQLNKIRHSTNLNTGLYNGLRNEGVDKSTVTNDKIINDKTQTTHYSEKRHRKDSKSLLSHSIVVPPVDRMFLSQKKGEENISLPSHNHKSSNVNDNENETSKPGYEKEKPFNDKDRNITFCQSLKDVSKYRYKTIQNLCEVPNRNKTPLTNVATASMTSVPSSASTYDEYESLRHFVFCSQNIGSASDNQPMSINTFRNIHANEKTIFKQQQSNKLNCSQVLPSRIIDELEQNRILESTAGGFTTIMKPNHSNSNKRQMLLKRYHSVAGSCSECYSLLCGDLKCSCRVHQCYSSWTSGTEYVKPLFNCKNNLREICECGNFIPSFSERSFSCVCSHFHVNGNLSQCSCFSCKNKNHSTDELSDYCRNDKCKNENSRIMPRVEQKCVRVEREGQLNTCYKFVSNSITPSEAIHHHFWKRRSKSTSDIEHYVCLSSSSLPCPYSEINSSSFKINNKEQFRHQSCPIMSSNHQHQSQIPSSSTKSQDSQESSPLLENSEQNTSYTIPTLIPTTRPMSCSPIYSLPSIIQDIKADQHECINNSISYLTSVHAMENCENKTIPAMATTTTKPLVSQTDSMCTPSIKDGFKDLTQPSQASPSRPSRLTGTIISTQIHNRNELTNLLTSKPISNEVKEQWKMSDYKDPPTLIIPQNIISDRSWVSPDYQYTDHTLSESGVTANPPVVVLNRLYPKDLQQLNQKANSTVWKENESFVQNVSVIDDKEKNSPKRKTHSPTKSSGRNKIKRKKNKHDGSSGNLVFTYRKVSKAFKKNRLKGDISKRTTLKWHNISSPIKLDKDPYSTKKVAMTTSLEGKIIRDQLSTSAVGNVKKYVVLQKNLNEPMNEDTQYIDADGDVDLKLNDTNDIEISNVTQLMMKNRIEAIIDNEVNLLTSSEERESNTWQSQSQLCNIKNNCLKSQNRLPEKCVNKNMYSVSESKGKLSDNLSTGKCSKMKDEESYHDFSLAYSLVPINTSTLSRCTQSTAMETTSSTPELIMGSSLNDAWISSKEEYKSGVQNDCAFSYLGRPHPTVIPSLTKKNKLQKQIHPYCKLQNESDLTSMNPYSHPLTVDVNEEETKQDMDFDAPTYEYDPMTNYELESSEKIHSDYRTMMKSLNNSENTNDKNIVEAKNMKWTLPISQSSSMSIPKIIITSCDSADDKSTTLGLSPMSIPSPDMSFSYSFTENELITLPRLESRDQNKDSNAECSPTPLNFVNICDKDNSIPKGVWLSPNEIKACDFHTASKNKTSKVNPSRIYSTKSDNTEDGHDSDDSDITVSYPESRQRNDLSSLCMEVSNYSPASGSVSSLQCKSTIGDGIPDDFLQSPKSSETKESSSHKCTHQISEEHVKKLASLVSDIRERISKEKAMKRKRNNSYSGRNKSSMNGNPSETLSRYQIRPIMERFTSVEPLLESDKPLESMSRHTGQIYNASSEGETDELLNIVTAIKSKSFTSKCADELSPSNNSDVSIADDKTEIYQLDKSVIGKIVNESITHMNTNGKSKKTVLTNDFEGKKRKRTKGIDIPVAVTSMPKKTFQFSEKKQSHNLENSVLATSVNDFTNMTFTDDIDHILDKDEEEEENLVIDNPELDEIIEGEEAYQKLISRKYKLPTKSQVRKLNRKRFVTGVKRRKAAMALLKEYRKALNRKNKKMRKGKAEKGETVGNGRNCEFIKFMSELNDDNKMKTQQSNETNNNESGENGATNTSDYLKFEADSGVLSSLSVQMTSTPEKLNIERDKKGKDKSYTRTVSTSSSSFTSSGRVKKRIAKGQKPNKNKSTAGELSSL